MNRVFSLVIQEERHRGLSSSNHFPFVSSSNSAAFGVAASNYNSYKGKRDKPLCTHCGFLGHTIDKCYKIHGYPLGFKKKFSDQNRGQMKQYGSVANQIAAGSESMEETMSTSQCQQRIAFLSSKLQNSFSSETNQQPVVSSLTGQYSGCANWDG
ncbi:hypothetical protein UlMin_033903 [Ulmus minor]